jgi:hypothetical protein
MQILQYHVDTQFARLLAENYRSSDAALKEFVGNEKNAHRPARADSPGVHRHRR